MKNLIFILMLLLSCSNTFKPDNKLIGAWKQENNSYNPVYTFYQDNTFTCFHNGKSVAENSTWYSEESYLYLSYESYYTDWTYLNLVYRYVISGDSLIFIMDNGVTDIFFR